MQNILKPTELNEVQHFHFPATALHSFTTFAKHGEQEEVQDSVGAMLMENGIWGGCVQCVVTRGRAPDAQL